MGLAEETFQFALTGVRDQDIPRCLVGLQRNPLTRKFLAERVKEHFDELEKRFAGTFNFKRFIEVCSKNLILFSQFWITGLLAGFIPGTIIGRGL